VARLLGEAFFLSKCMGLLCGVGRFEIDDSLLGAFEDGVAVVCVEPILTVLASRQGHHERFADNLEHQDTCKNNEILLFIRRRMGLMPVILY
jgi:hypothetical protein